MENVLKQSTAVVITLGPFVDKTDGITLKTGLISALDHASTGIMLAKNGGTLAVRHATVTASAYDAHGMYKVTLDTTDTGTLGALRVVYTDATTCLPVWRDFEIIPANVYDSMVAGSANLAVNAAYVGGTGQSAGVDLGTVLPTVAPTTAGGVRDVYRVAGTTQTARDLGNALPAQTPGASGGLFIAGQNAATSIITSGGTALILGSTGGNGHGLQIAGNGTGKGITIAGGASGVGMYITGTDGSENVAEQLAKIDDLVPGAAVNVTMETSEISA